jgi:hypothetical protein
MATIAKARQSLHGSGRLFRCQRSIPSAAALTKRSALDVVRMGQGSKHACCYIVEMDMPAGDEGPRSFAVRSAKPLAGLTPIARFRKCMLDVTSRTGISRICSIVTPLQGGKSELIIKTRTADGHWTRIALGRRYQLDASLLDKLKAIDGIANVELAPLGPVLALVH